MSDGLAGIEVLDFWVPGHPKTKGSLTPRARKCRCCDKCTGFVGKVQLVDTEASKRWRKLVAYRAERAIVERDILRWGMGFPIEGQVGLDLGFALDIDDVIQMGAGDTDKLYRNVLDALTDAGVYVDDVQVVKLTGYKIESERFDQVGEYGVRVRVSV